MDNIEPKQTEWASPNVPVLRNYGTLCICVDYRKVNEVMICDLLKISCTDNCVYSLRYWEIFSTLDDNSGYLLVEIAEKDHDETAFTSPRGLFRFAPILFGSRNAS